MMRALALLLAFSAGAFAEEVHFKDACLRSLVAEVPRILSTQDAASGRFGRGIWLVTDNNVLFPLAVAWSYKHAVNPHYHSPELLSAIMQGGDALIEDQDSTGRWVFRKKDGSTWGKILMPWTYAVWIRSFALIREAMPPERRTRWERALRLGFASIYAELQKARVHNIPAQHAMALYIAGRVFGEVEWSAAAQNFLRRVASAQDPDGFWAENAGPVVAYGFVYTDALGVYYAHSSDTEVLPALERASIFHSWFTYPDGSLVETIDERNPYHAGARMPNLGFAFSREGRAHIARLIRIRKGSVQAHEAADLLLHAEEGEGDSLPAGDYDYVLPSGRAAIRRRGPWFLVASAFTSPVIANRWIQDRQNFVSIYHDSKGLIAGGGNTKLQPYWSNFTTGPIETFDHKHGDEKPNFMPPTGVIHVPSKVSLLAGGDFGVALEYLGQAARIKVRIRDDRQLELTTVGGSDASAQIVLLPRVGTIISTTGGKRFTLGEEEFTSATGGRLTLDGIKVEAPKSTIVRWPARPHNPYRKDGRADIREARVVLRMPAKAQVRIVVAPYRRPQRQ